MEQWICMVCERGFVRSGDCPECCRPLRLFLEEEADPRSKLSKLIKALRYVFLRTAA